MLVGRIDPRAACMGLSLCFSMSCVVLGEKGSFVLLKNLLVQKGQGNLEVEGTETSFSYQGKWDFPWNHKDEACRGRSCTMQTKQGSEKLRTK